MKVSIFLASATAALALGGCNKNSNHTTATAANDTVTITQANPPPGGTWADVVNATSAGFMMGNPNAKVKLVEIGSLFCPVCKRFDDEGVRAHKAQLIDHGKLVGFDMGRNPIPGFPHSNGHGRRSPGLPPVARQGNLVVEAAKYVEYKDLEKMLLEEVKKQHRPYGMIFTDISGGFTNTSAFAPQAFKVNPVMAYRLYPDGHKELVRGIDISGTPLVALQSIRAASREIETFNGVCGAESGWVPVSASAPSLLLEKLEIEKGFIPPDRPPILNAPSIRKEAP